MMNNMDQIIAIIRDEIDVMIDEDVEINENTNLAIDLGVDSLDMALIVGRLEEEFDIKIANEDTIGIRTVKDIVAKVEELQKKEGTVQ